MSSIDVTIDEVVLRGVRPGGQYEFADALHRRLEGLIGDSVMENGRWRDREESSRRLAPVSVDEGSPSDLGEAVAAAIHDLTTGGSDG